MPKIRSGPSKRMTSRQRHKIDRKKREHKRDLRKAAKVMKKSGLGPKRSKKTRELAKLALKVSNAHPDKECILQRVLQAREEARIERRRQRMERQGDDEHKVGRGAHPVTAPQQCRRYSTFIPISEAKNFSYQFNRVLTELVFPTSETFTELPSAAYLVTLDARCAVQCLPWGLLDAIIREGNLYKTSGGQRKIMVLFALTKCDLVSAPALVSQICLLAHVLSEQYVNVPDKNDGLSVGESIYFAFCPVSQRFDKTVQHLSTILRRFRSSDGCSKCNNKSNLSGKLCCFVVGLPNTGRRTLCRMLLQHDDSNTSIVPVSAAQLQVLNGVSGEASEGSVKLAFPNAKEVTLLQFPEDAALRKELSNLSGTEVIFKSPNAIESLPDPEVVGHVLYDAVMNKEDLAQGFCQPSEPNYDTTCEKESFYAAARFFTRLGQTVRRLKGFYVSPSFIANAGTMGRICSSALTASVSFTSCQEGTKTTLLNATCSGATPSRLVRVFSVVSKGSGKKGRGHSAKRSDYRNVMRLGARTFVREIYRGRNVPWAVMRSPLSSCLTISGVERDSTIFNASVCLGRGVGSVVGLESHSDHLAALIDFVSSLLKQYLTLLPNNVVEFNPSSIVAPIHNLASAYENKGHRNDNGEVDENDGDSEEEGHERG